MCVGNNLSKKNDWGEEGCYRKGNFGVKSPVRNLHYK